MSERSWWIGLGILTITGIICLFYEGSQVGTTLAIFIGWQGYGYYKDYIN